MPLEALIDVCIACAGPGPSAAPSLIGSSSSPFTGPAPDDARSERSDSASDSDAPRHRDDPSDRPGDEASEPPSDGKPSLWDRLFGGDAGADVATDVATTVGQDLLTESALDIASQRLPGAAGVTGALGSVVSGSGVLAEGIHEAVVKNEGRGMGGSSESGKAAMDAAMNEINGTNNPRRRR